MAIHRIYLDGRAGAALEMGVLTVAGAEAQHAIRVKRLTKGDSIEVLDGSGSLGAGVIVGTVKDRTGWHLEVDVREVRIIPRVKPRLEVFSPAPKGPRLSELIDGLSQVGAACWSPLATALSVSDPHQTRLERMQRVAAEASKQCGRPWLLEIGPGRTLRSIFEHRPAGAAMVMADATGAAYTASGAGTVCLLVGPEGGWREDEVARARELGITIARFGPHVMRIETAAVAASAIVLDLESRQG